MPATKAAAIRANTTMHQASGYFSFFMAIAAVSLGIATVKKMV